MTRAILFVCVLAAILPAGCASGPRDMAAAERAVYASFFVASGGAHDEPLYVVAATDAAWFAENSFNADEWVPWLPHLGGIPMALVEELYRVNRTTVPIAENLSPANVVLLPADYQPPDTSDYDLRCLLEKEDWPKSGKDDEPDCDPQIYVTVSRVAFSRDRRHAMLKYYYHCRGLCASEGFVAFERDGQHWRQIGTRLLWIS